MNRTTKFGFALSTILFIGGVGLVVQIQKNLAAESRKPVTILSSKFIPAQTQSFEITDVRNIPDAIRTSRVWNGLTWVNVQCTFNQTIIQTSTNHTFSFAEPTNSAQDYDQNMFDARKDYTNPMALLHQKFTYNIRDAYNETIYRDAYGEVQTVATTKILPIHKKTLAGDVTGSTLDIPTTASLDGSKEKELLLTQP